MQRGAVDGVNMLLIILLMRCQPHVWPIFDSIHSWHDSLHLQRCCYSNCPVTQPLFPADGVWYIVKSVQFEKAIAVRILWHLTCSLLRYRKVARLRMQKILWPQAWALGSTNDALAVSENREWGMVLILQRVFDAYQPNVCKRSDYMYNSAITSSILKQRYNHLFCCWNAVWWYLNVHSWCAPKIDRIGNTPLRMPHMNMSTSL